MSLIKKNISASVDGRIVIPIDRSGLFSIWIEYKNLTGTLDCVFDVEVTNSNPAPADGVPLPQLQSVISDANGQRFLYTDHPIKGEFLILKFIPNGVSGGTYDVVAK